MTNRKETQGIETAKRISDWQRGSVAAERLASIALRIDGFSYNDPAHPLGGPDGGVDIRCKRDETSYVVSVYFPRGQVSFNETKKKFCGDVAKSNEIAGFIFVTNQELTIGNRQELIDVSGDRKIEIYHLERISTLLNCPIGYGARLEFLDIDMNKEEQASFIAENHKIISDLASKVNELLAIRNKSTVKDGVHVQPQPINPYYMASYFGRQLYFCKKCGYGYFVGSSMHSVTTVMAVSGAYSITCPSCQNTEYWNRPFF